jgi:REP element-mobilizing transposase RayT
MNQRVPLEEGKYYHVYNRGNNRCKLFYEDRNYEHFLSLFSKYINTIADPYAWVLMGNHFHFLLKMKKDFTVAGKKLDPSRQFSHFFNAYAQAINKSVGRTGSLFEHNFERKEVTTNEYLRQLIVYIHRNPQKHRFADYYRDYPWSSFKTILNSKNGLLETEQIIELFGGREKFIHAHENIDEINDVRWMIE